MKDDDKAAKYYEMYVQAEVEEDHLDQRHEGYSEAYFFLAQYYIEQKVQIRESEVNRKFVNLFCKHRKSPRSLLLFVELFCSERLFFRRAVCAEVRLVHPDARRRRKAAQEAP